MPLCIWAPFALLLPRFTHPMHASLCHLLPPLHPSYACAVVSPVSPASSILCMRCCVTCFPAHLGICSCMHDPSHLLSNAVVRRMYLINRTHMIGLRAWPFHPSSPVCLCVCVCVLIHPHLCVYCYAGMSGGMGGGLSGGMGGGMGAGGMGATDLSGGYGASDMSAYGGYGGQPNMTSQYQQPSSGPMMGGMGGGGMHQVKGSQRTCCTLSEVLKDCWG